MDKKELKRQSRNENRKILWPIVLSSILIMANLVGAKYTNLATNINISNSIIIYPISFLIVILISRAFGTKYAKKCVYMAAVAQVLFLLGLVLVSFMRSNADSAYVRAYIEYLFTPNSTSVFGISFSYPHIIMYTLSLCAFVLSHLLSIKLYESTVEICPRAFAFGIAFFLPYIIDALIYTGGYNAINMLLTSKFELVKLVRFLTGQFIGVFLSGVIMIIVFMIVNAIIKPDQINENNHSNDQEKDIVNDTQVIAPVVNPIIEVKEVITDNVSVDDLPVLK